MQFMKKSFNRRTIVTGLLLSLSNITWASQHPPEHIADRIFTGAKIFTSDKSQPWAEAVAIKGGKIVYVGDDAGIDGWRGDNTQDIDLNGQLVLPGFVDSHVHPGLIGLLTNVVFITDSDTPEKMLDWLKEYAEDNPDLPYILAGIWDLRDYGLEGPQRKDLDAAVNDRPVIVLDNSGHSSWLNSKALALLGGDPESVDGLSFLQADKAGRPTGWAKEFVATKSLNLLMKPNSVEDFEDALTLYMDYALANGVTTVFDAGNLGREDVVYSRLAKMDKEGRMPLRYEGSYHVTMPSQLDHAVAELKRLRSQYGSNNLRFNTIKIHYDGVTELHTAAVIQEYSNKAGHRGNTLVNEDRLADFIRELHREQIDLHLHVVADAATRRALNAYETVKNELAGKIDTRMTLSHLELVDDADMPRFKELGVIANFTPQWHGDTQFILNEHIIGSERFQKRYRAQPLLENGAVVSFSSDEVSTYGITRTNPMLGIHNGHNRQEGIDGEGKDALIMQPISERLKLEDLVTGFTQSGAYQLGMEDQVGSISVGKSADLVIMRDDLFSMDRYDIYEAKVSMTVKAGEVVYQRNWRKVVQEWYSSLLRLFFNAFYA